MRKASASLWYPTSSVLFSCDKTMSSIPSSMSSVLCPHRALLSFVLPLISDSLTHNQMASFYSSGMCTSISYRWTWVLCFGNLPLMLIKSFSPFGLCYLGHLVARFLCRTGHVWTSARWESKKYRLSFFGASCWSRTIDFRRHRSYHVLRALLTSGYSCFCVPES